jgi:dTDP-4-dehydrorhamnose reductase
MKHLIIGNGNLGIDLLQKLSKNNEQVDMVSRSTGFEYPTNKITEPMLEKYDVIWNAVGAGSINEVKENPQRGIDLHVNLVQALAERKSKHTVLINFSTDYVACEDNPTFNTSVVETPRSLYAETKKIMESRVKSFPEFEIEKVYAVRIGSLYGKHKPDFRNRLLASYLSKGQDTIMLPQNSVSPTPTKWLAEKLVDRFSDLLDCKYPIQHLSPLGTTTVAGWGRLILGDKATVLAGDLFDNRPHHAYLDTSYFHNTDSIYDLWEQYGND